MGSPDNGREQRLIVTLTCCFSYSRSEKLKYIWLFTRLIVTLQIEIKQQDKDGR